MRTNERGLALLLVVSLMALVTLMVVSLAVITRIETRVGGVRAEQARARDNALLGLRTALGRLQEAAGPDRRVTATAESTGPTNQPHWVGVWRTDTVGPEPETWLVSGGGPDPRNAAAPSRQHVTLVRGDGSANLRVTAPLELLRTSNDRESVNGGFAYFVADQGLKASLTAAAPAPAQDDFFGQRRLLMGGSRALGFGDDGAVDAARSSFQAGLANLKHHAQLTALEPENAAVIQSRWHDYAGWSRGLLVNTANGGLKTDLSLAGATAIPGLAAFTSLATPDRQIELSPTYPMRPVGGGTGDLYDGIHPIITQIGMQFSVHTISSTSRTLETRLRFFVELTNPYAAALEAEDLRLVVSGLPRDVAIEARTVGTARDHGGATVNLESLYARHADAAGRPAIEFDLPFGASRWEPGRTLTWRLPAGDTMGEAANRELVYDASTRTSFWRERPGSALDGPDALVASSELRFTGTDDWQVGFSLRRGDGDELVSGLLPVFFPVETAWLDANSTLPDFGMEARLVDRSGGVSASGDSPWLREELTGDLRRRVYGEDWWVPKVDLETASYNVAFAAPNSGVEARQLFNRDPVDRSYLSYYQPGYNSDVALFELPRQPWLSVGALQHLPFGEGPIYNVGNSWSERNDWFDAFFFSGRTAGALGNETTLSPVLERVDASESLIDARSGQQWWVRGAFNINSVRPAAWAAVLRGLGTGRGDLTLAYPTHAADTGLVNGVSTATLPRPLARFAQSAGETWEISPNPENFQAVLRTYRRGARSLTEPQVQGLAQVLADSIRARTSQVGPYRSMAEFLAPDMTRFAGRNVIEHAIFTHDEGVVAADRINWDQYFPDAPIPIDEAAPSFLTSADFMTPLAPQLSARSDTFIIRAYGETVPETRPEAFATSEPVGRAWVEAVVQRYPDGVTASDYAQADDSDWRTPMAEETWGRRFRVVALRWLREEDL